VFFLNDWGSATMISESSSTTTYIYAGNHSSGVVRDLLRLIRSYVKCFINLKIYNIPTLVNEAENNNDSIWDSLFEKLGLTELYQYAFEVKYKEMKEFCNK